MDLVSLRTSGSCSVAPSPATARAPRSSNGTPIFPRSTFCWRRQRLRSGSWNTSVPRSRMPSLRELQLDLGRALLGGHCARVAAEIVDNGVPAEARLAIYRHHVLT